MKISFRNDICIIAILSCLSVLLGTSLLVSEHWNFLKPIKYILAKDVMRIEKGVKELIYMPPGGTSATLDDSEPGFNEILSVMLNHDKNDLVTVKEITHRLDFVDQFYWQQKGFIGAIFLNSVAGAGKKSQVHPVNFASTVFGWIEQERVKRLTVDSFIWLFGGAILALIACFLTISNKTHNPTTQSQSYKPIKSIILFVISYAMIVVFANKFIDAKDYPMFCLTAALVSITAYYAMLTHGILQQSRDSSRAGIRPLVIGSRLSKEGEIGVYAGDEGMNRNLYLINVGAGHAHNVNIRVSPPAEAIAVGQDGAVAQEGPIRVMQGIELPVRARRMWNNHGGLCGGGSNWHYMYAEYEDTEGNQYYTIQSGYNVKKGKMQELQQRKRKSDQDVVWVNVELQDWLKCVDPGLKQWAEQQREIYKQRTAASK